jgi:hypothetical protein
MYNVKYRDMFIFDLNNIKCMFCPGCGHYLNRNVYECPYCNCCIKPKTGLGMEPKDNGSSPDAPASIPEEKPIGSDLKKRKCIFDTKDRYHIISFVLSILLILCMVLPWMIWTDGEQSIRYNAIDMLSFKWEGASSFSRIIPMISSICGIVSLVGLLLRTRRTCTVCLSFAASLLSVILILVFYIMTYLYTGLTCYYGFYFAFLVSLALTIFNLNVAEGLKSWKKKKPTKKDN